jgi:flagellar biosynthesis protein
MADKHHRDINADRSRAVALKYQPQSDSAPRVVAKGQGELAEKIIAIARDHGIHIYEDPDMVELLSQLDLKEEIPADLYVVVAELLAFVYGVNRKEAPA